MNKIYLDCNILLDWLIDRAPYSYYATEIIVNIEKHKYEGCVSGLTLANTYYILRKEKNRKIATEFLIDSKKLFTILDLTKKNVVDAIENKYKDFEDDLHYMIARDNAIKYIITRNKGDFKEGNIKIMTAEEFIKNL